MAFYPEFHGHGNSGGITSSRGTEVLRAPGSNGLVDLWDGLVKRLLPSTIKIVGAHCGSLS